MFDTLLKAILYIVLLFVFVKLVMHFKIIKGLESKAINILFENNTFKKNQNTTKII